MIRAAKPDDIPAMLEMGDAFHQEAGHAESVPFSVPDFHATLCILANANLLLVVESEGEIIGMGAADVAPSLCNRAVRIGREAFWYLKPGHRNGHGRKLLAALECAAKAQGAAFFDAVAEDGERSEALARLYRAASYKPTERTFRKAL